MPLRWCSAVLAAEGLSQFIAAPWLGQLAGLILGGVLAFARLARPSGGAAKPVGGTKL